MSLRFGVLCSVCGWWILQRNGAVVIGAVAVFSCSSYRVTKHCWQNYPLGILKQKVKGLPLTSAYRISQQSVELFCLVLIYWLSIYRTRFVLIQQMDFNFLFLISTIVFFSSVRDHRKDFFIAISWFGQCFSWCQNLVLSVFQLMKFPVHFSITC